jgi:putative Holliday junction resolvase
MKQPSSFLCVDPGGKRTGLALGDKGTAIATPLDVIHTTSPDERMRLILAAVKREGPDALVMGLPLHMDGRDSPAADASRKLAKELKEKSGLPVFLVDERTTSDEADEAMAMSGLTHAQKKARRDALAAAALLRRFFDEGALEEAP